MKRFAFAILSLALLHAFVGFRIAARWPWAQDNALAYWYIVLCVFVLGLIAPVFEVFIGSHKPAVTQAPLRWLDRLSYLTLGVFSCLFVYTLAADIVAICWEVLLPPDNMDDFNRNMLIVLALATLATTVAGVVQAAMKPQVVQVDVALENLPPAFDGFKIVQISDLHVGPTIGRRYAQKVVDMANALGADLFALTGDFIDGEVDALKRDVSPLAQLAAPHGSFFITGNHEYYWDADGWCAHFKSLGIDVLGNEHRIIRAGDAAFVLAGVTDISTLHHKNHPHASDPHKAIEGAPAGLVNILLAHQPNSYIEAEKAGFHLQLSGHTHAGQYFPYSLVIRFFQKYYKGLNRHGRLQIYVNRGTGYWGPPLRTLVRGEITVICLRRAGSVRPNA